MILKVVLIVIFTFIAILLIHHSITVDVINIGLNPEPVWKTPSGEFISEARMKENIKRGLVPEGYSQCFVPNGTFIQRAFGE